MSRVRLVLAGALAAASIGAADARAAGVYTVTGYADSTGACNGTSCPSLRSAVAKAATDPGATVQLGAGQYTLSLGPLAIGTSMTLTGLGATQTTIRQTDGKDTVIVVSGGTSTISNLTITGGNDEGRAGLANPGSTGGPGGNAFGGGVGVIAGSLTLSHTTVTGNTAQGGAGGTGAPGGMGGTASGGGIANNGALTVEYSTISANRAIGGAGASGTTNGGAAGAAVGGGIENSGSVSVIDSTISGNQAVGGAGGLGSATTGVGGLGGEADGGGLGETNVGAGATVLSSTTSGNTATGGAGGAAAKGGTSASGGLGNGGGLLVEGGATVADSTLSSNSAQGGPAPAGGGAGTAGIGEGGGLEFVQTSNTVTLAADTLASNTATTDGGNIGLQFSSLPQLIVRDTVIAAGSAPLRSNCSSGVQLDGQNNLEDDGDAECGFSAADHDLVGEDPELGPLGANGGPTETMALLAGSPALGAGGECTIPALAPPATLITTDQRGQPRPNPCDIGAFEHQPPVNRAAPMISGRPLDRARLACARGTWTGDPSMKFSYRWLRDGHAIKNATTGTHRLSQADAGQKLSCAVIATNSYAHSTATSAATTVPRAPTITHLRATGKTVRFRLSEAASVRLRFAAKHRKTRTVTATKRRGSDTVELRPKLAPGRYKMTVTATANGFQSAPATLRLTIAGR